MISILCPTRGRPELCNHMVETAVQAADYPAELEILLYVDDDDETRARYAPHPRVTVVSGPARRVGAAWNVLARAARGTYLAMGNDDQAYVTRGWDTVLRRTPLPTDGIWMAWFNDGTPKAPKRCAFPIVTRTWYEALGYFTPECFRFFYHDTWIHDLAQRVKRAFYIPEVLVEHRHFSRDKTRWDGTYARNRLAFTSSKDAATWADTEERRERDAARLALRLHPNGTPLWPGPASIREETS